MRIDANSLSESVRVSSKRILLGVELLFNVSISSLSKEKKATSELETKVLIRMSSKRSPIRI